MPGGYESTSLLPSLGPQIQAKLFSDPVLSRLVARCAPSITVPQCRHHVRQRDNAVNAWPTLDPCSPSKKRLRAIHWQAHTHAHRYNLSRCPQSCQLPRKGLHEGSRPAILICARQMPGGGGRCAWFPPGDFRMRPTHTPGFVSVYPFRIFP